MASGHGAQGFFSLLNYHSSAQASGVRLEKERQSHFKMHLPLLSGSKGWTG